MLGGKNHPKSFGNLGVRPAHSLLMEEKGAPLYATECESSRTQESCPRSLPMGHSEDICRLDSRCESKTGVAELSSGFCVFCHGVVHVGERSADVATGEGGDFDGPLLRHIGPAQAQHGQEFILGG